MYCVAATAAAKVTSKDVAAMQRGIVIAARE